MAMYLEEMRDDTNYMFCKIQSLKFILGIFLDGAFFRISTDLFERIRFIDGAVTVTQRKMTQLGDHIKIL